MAISCRAAALLCISISAIASSENAAASGAPYCDQVRQADIVQQLSGQFPFGLGNIIYRSQNEKTSDNGVYHYRYCVENTDPFTPIAIRWEDKTDKSIIVFDGFVYQQDKVPVSFDMLDSQAPAQFEMSYGYQKDRWEGTKTLATVYQKTSASSSSPLTLIQFDSRDTNSIPIRTVLSKPELIDQYLKVNKSFRLSSGTVVSIPVSNLAIHYLNNDQKITQKPEFPIEFVRVEVTFASTVESSGDGNVILNVGGYLSASPVDFVKAESIRNVNLSVTGGTMDGLGEVNKAFDGRFVTHTEGQQHEDRETVAPGGVWFQSHTKAAGAISQTRREVVVTGEGGLQIARFPVTILVPTP